MPHSHPLCDLIVSHYQESATKNICRLANNDHRHAPPLLALFTSGLEYRELITVRGLGYEPAQHLCRRENDW